MAPPADTAAPHPRGIDPTTAIIAAAAVVLALSFGVRATFGIVLDPVSQTFGWPIAVFSLSIAIQNMVWGLAQPLFGLIADRYGDRRALWLGLGCYALGMVATVVSTTPMMQHLGAGLLVGAGVSGTAFGIVLAVVGRAVPEARRAQAMGLTAALGAFGQVTLPPLASWLTVAYGWQTTMGVMTLLLLPMALAIPIMTPARRGTAPAAAEPAVPLGEMLRRAVGHPSYVLLALGFFVCGFHIAFMTVHLPTYIYDMCGSVALGGTALAIIGGANVVGTLVAGQLGARFPKPYILSAIYALRAVVIAVFIAIPTTPLTVIVFSGIFGMLWLSTVPLTSALVATMFGTRALATLYGFVFLSHQVGSFFGVYIGGRVYDAFGTYEYMWYAAIVLGVVSALVHLPVRDRAWQAPVGAPA
ncbi:MAG: MFS transporter [Pseudomonadota bacterium]